jgi:uncharacterized membrane protein
MAVYNDLPEKIVIQWNMEGNPNRYAHKAIAAFGLPLFFMVINVISGVLLFNDPKKDNVSKSIRTFLEWIFAFLSLLITPIILFIGMGLSIPVRLIILVFVGIFLVIYGNYMPKSKQNYLVGVTLPWTLNDTENWKKQTEWQDT